jgi:hypothetical protein
MITLTKSSNLETTNVASFLVLVLTSIVPIPPKKLCIFCKRGKSRTCVVIVNLESTTHLLLRFRTYTVVVKQASAQGPQAPLPKRVQVVAGLSGGCGSIEPF